MDMKYLLLNVEDKVATVTIHRPDKGNALAPEVLEEVEYIFTEIAKRQDVNVVVLTGGEKFFSAGFDLTIIRKLEKVSNEDYTALFHRAYRAILYLRSAGHLRGRRSGHRGRVRPDPDVRHPVCLRAGEVRSA